jgi:uncharacterized protein YjbI with pentapeptide repeats
MAEFSRTEIYLLMNGAKPLWLVGADLSGADLTGANMRGADLRRANLRNANLSGAHLADANLSDADLDAAMLTGAELDRVIHNNFTRWPAGFRRPPGMNTTIRM